MFALAAGVGAVLAAEQFDPSFHGVEDLREFTSVPVLASIPRIGRGYQTRVAPCADDGVVVAVIAIFATVSTHAARGNEEIVWMLVRGA